MNERVPQWHEMDLATREQQYSPSSMVGGDLTPFLQRYERECATVYADRDCRTVRYGEGSSNTVDLFDAGPGSPLHVYIHGGYWQQLSKRDSVFPAPAFLSAGYSFAAVGYTLAPDARIDEMVDESVAALRELHQLGYAPETITLSGWSAGAQLAVMTIQRLHNHERPGRLVMVSGIFDLEPLVGTYVNDPLGMDVTEARVASPLHLDPAEIAELPPSIVVFGDADTDEFKRQSRAMVDVIHAAGGEADEREIADRNHFDVIFELGPTLVEGSKH